MANRIAERRGRRVACYSLFRGEARRFGYYRKDNPPRFVCGPKLFDMPTPPLA